MPIDQETLDALKTLVDQKLAPQAPSAAPQPYGSQPGGLMAPQPLSPMAILLPTKITLQDGREARVYLQIDASQCHGPQDVIALINQAAAMMPIDAYMPRQQSGWGGGGQGGGGYQSGGGYQQRGGYGGGGRRW